MSCQRGQNSPKPLCAKPQPTTKQMTPSWQETSSQCYFPMRLYQKTFLCAVISMSVIDGKDKLNLSFYQKNYPKNYLITKHLYYSV